MVALAFCISRAKAKLASTVGSLLSFYCGRISTKQKNSGFASQWSAASAEAELAAECQLSSLSAAGPRLRTEGCAQSAHAGRGVKVAGSARHFSSPAFQPVEWTTLDQPSGAVDRFLTYSRFLKCGPPDAM